MKTQTRIRRPKESAQSRADRAKKILRGLKRLYPEADCALRHQSALELLIATILSAKSTDETVNKVTPVLFAAFPTAKALANAPLSEIEKLIHSTGFFRQKSKSVKNACTLLVEKYGGDVPDTMEELVQLPGVARKTANVVLGTWFQKNEGIVVDTHVGRLAERLAITWRSKNSKDAVKIERDLIEIVPQKDWTYLSHAMIQHGRRVCPARKPACDGCTLAKHCPSAGTFE